MTVNFVGNENCNFISLRKRRRIYGYIGKHFKLGESTVRAIKKNEAAIRKSIISGTKLSTKFASYTRDVLLERTERAIAIWFEEQVQRRIPVSGYLIQEKALQFYKSMKQSEPSTSTSQAGKEFSASKGWLTGFLKRNALHNIKITGESATADEGAAKIFPEELAKFIEDGDYSADQVFNADETGHYWKKLPNRTYIAKDEKTASGHKTNLTVDGVVGPEGDNDEEEKSTLLTGKLIQEGLQLCSKLENRFFINDPNSERASKLQCYISHGHKFAACIVSTETRSPHVRDAKVWRMRRQLICGRRLFTEIKKNRGPSPIPLV
ncbi:tigger transposable element-derived protein 1 [Trichonephila clavipes]|nr:tigger transposable element-derived protein 1 [Trichonephila clavipes]